jgi:predicted nucleic acid-binding protein
MIAYLRGETGADIVEALLVEDAEPCMAHVINLCEVYYLAIRLSDEASAASIIEDLKSKGLVVREDFDQSFWQTVGRYKAVMRSVPLADCFVAALANRTGAEAVTTDHDDFGPIKERGICRVTFIRPKRQTPGQASQGT